MKEGVPPYLVTAADKRAESPEKGKEKKKKKKSFPPSERQFQPWGTAKLAQ